MKISSLLITVLFVITLAVTITGCTYEKHYYGEEKMIDEGVVVREHYIVE